MSSNKERGKAQIVEVVNPAARMIHLPGLASVAFEHSGYAPSVSVIIPTFNERENIVSLVRETCSRLNDNVKDYEVIIVDDASPDGTFEMARALREENGKVRIVHRPGRMGLGSAIMDGLKCSTGEVVVPIDADFSHPPESILSLLNKTKEFDIVVGSRYVKGGIVFAPFRRVFLSRMLNFVIRMILGLHVYDCTGGFMAVRRKVFNPIFVRGKSGDYAFELLYKAQRRGLKIVEVPFTYRFRERGESKTGVIRYGLRYFVSALLLKVRREHFADS